MAERNVSLSASDRTALGVVGVLTAVAAPLAAVSIVVIAVTAFGQPLTVTGLTVHDAPMPTPVGTDAAAFDTASVTLSDAPAHLRWLVFAGGALPALATGTVGVAAAWLGIGVLRGRPFIRGAAATVFAMGAALIVGGVFGSLVRSIARAATTAHLESLDPTFSGTFLAFENDIDLTTIWLALTLLLVGVVFQIGRRMQKDTEGLV